MNKVTGKLAAGVRKVKTRALAEDGRTVKAQARTEAVEPGDDAPAMAVPKATTPKVSTPKTASPEAVTIRPAAGKVAPQPDRVWPD